MKVRTSAGIVVMLLIAVSNAAGGFTLELTAPANNSYLKGQLAGTKTEPVFNVPAVNMMVKITPIPESYGQQHPVFHYKYVPTGDEKTISMDWSQNQGNTAIYVASGPWEITKRRREYDCYATWSGYTSNTNRTHIAKGRQAEEIAEQWVGAPYHYGGKGPAYCPGNPTHGAPDYCFDCSGLVWWCYEKTNMFQPSGPTPSYDRNAQWFHDHPYRTPENNDPVKGDYITFGDCDDIDHVAMQRTTGQTYGMIEAKPPQVTDLTSYNPNDGWTDCYGSMLSEEEIPAGD